MNDQKKAGKTGKSFYAALSLSVAMVGAACWYAYTEAGKLTPPATVPEQNAVTTAAPVGTAARLTQTTTTAPTTTSRTTTTADAEEAAAILRHTTTTASTTATTVTATTAAPVVQPMAPVSGTLLQGFSHHELVKSPTTGIWQTHNGVDYGAAIGTDVSCVMDGTVIAIERDALWGVCVTMLHNDGTVTRYCGLCDGLNVEAGQIISRGTVLGTIGDTNEAEGSLPAHLHFEVLQNDFYMDPQGYLSGTLEPAE